MTENVLIRANIRLLPGDMQTAERVPLIIPGRSVSLTMEHNFIDDAASLLNS